MKSKQQVFFSTRSDLIEMMSIVEKRIPIEYVLMGTFESEVIKRESTISKFSQLGYTRYRNWISLDNRYMVVPLNESVKCRTVVQRNGLCHYIIDLSSMLVGTLTEGKVYDPYTGEELKWDQSSSRTWDMGHKPGKEYRKLHQDYMNGKISKEKFLEEYRNPNNYLPQSRQSNRSHKHEKK